MSGHRWVILLCLAYGLWSLFRATDKCKPWNERTYLMARAAVFFVIAYGNHS